MRQAAKLVVRDRRQLGERAPVTVAPGSEKRTDVIRTGSSTFPRGGIVLLARLYAVFTASLHDSSLGCVAY